MTFIVLLTLNDEQKSRMDDANDEPKWFGYPIKKTNYDVYFTRSLTDCFKMIVKNKMTGFLVFNIDILEVLLSIFSYLFPNKIRTCTLYQWKPFDKLNILKTIAYKLVINRSKVIVSYSASSIEYLKNIWKKKNFIWIGLFTDTNFFQPENTSHKTEEYLLCPGNHLRDEEMILSIAKATGKKIIRYSNDRLVKEYYSINQDKIIDFKYNLNFKEVRSLYSNSMCVLNVCNDIEIPAGITTFCEGLAMNKIVITPAGHSSSGYIFDTGEVPYIRITNHENLVEWIQAIDYVANKNLKIKENFSPRMLAEKFVSFNAVNRRWSDILSILFSSNQV